MCVWHTVFGDTFTVTHVLLICKMFNIDILHERRAKICGFSVNGLLLRMESVSMLAIMESVLFVSG